MNEAAFEKKMVREARQRYRDYSGNRNWVIELLYVIVHWFFGGEK